MAADDTLADIVGALAAAPPPITAAGECLLCGSHFTVERALDGGIGHHARRCAWQRAQVRKRWFAQRLLAELARPTETQIGMAFRLVVAAVANSHRLLDDAHFMGLLLAIYELAGELDCLSQLTRQVKRAARADTALRNRLNDWISTAESDGDPHAG